MAATGPVLSAAGRIGYLDLAPGGGERSFTVGPFTPPPSGGGGCVLRSRRPAPPRQAGPMVRRRTTIPGSFDPMSYKGFAEPKHLIAPPT